MPNERNNLTISARIREAREYLDLSLEELAQMIGMNAADLESVESGAAPITALSLANISRVVGRSLDFFTSDVPVQKAAERTEFLARAAETLSDQDLDELQRFAKYLRSRSESAAA